MTKDIPIQQIWPPEFVTRYQQAGYWQGETFSEFLSQRAETHPDHIAVVSGSTRWTYQDLNQRASAVAANLLRIGFKAGDRVIIHLPNIPEFLSAAFGLFRAGLIPIYALPAHRITEIEHFANTGGADAYLCTDKHAGFDYRELARELSKRCPSVKTTFIVGDAQEFETFDTLQQGLGHSASAFSTPSPQDVAFLQISGGSTGPSKLIPRTHDDYIYTLRESARICKLNANSIFLAALPIAHNFPMSSPGFMGTLYAGGRVVLSTSPSPEDCFPLIEKERASFTSLVPPLLLLWLEAAAKNSHDLSSLKVIQVGGAKLIPEVAKRVKPLLNVTLQQVFGMAEGLVNYTRLDDDIDTIIETQGRPISPDDEILIVDDNDVPVATGKPGHLLTRGPYTIRAYHNNAQANLRSFTDDGYYRTGDIVKLSEKGYLIVQGRAGDHINRAGEKISAEEVEDYLLSHPQVFDAAVVSIPDDYLGERSCAFVIAKDKKPRAIELKKWVRERGIAEFKVPDQIIFVDAFSETAAGKISRKTLRAQLRADIIQQSH